MAPPEPKAILLLKFEDSAFSACNNTSDSEVKMAPPSEAWLLSKVELDITNIDFWPYNAPPHGPPNREPNAKQ